MNLNKQMKEEIVRRVIADIPRKHSCSTHFQQKVSEILLEDAKQQLPAEVYQMWTSSLRTFLATIAGNVTYLIDTSDRYSLACEAPYGRCDTTRPSACQNITAQSKKKLQQVFNDSEQERKQIEAAKVRLGSALAGIRTRKQFIETFPELEKYAPEEIKPASLLPAVTNVVADLAKLGWPKTTTASAVAAA